MLVQLALVDEATPRTNGPLIPDLRIELALVLVTYDGHILHLLLLVDILLVVVYNQDFTTGIFFYELLHRHLNEHVVVHFVGTPTFKLASYSTIQVGLGLARVSVCC